jgi:CheY-like chemotaxis protein
MRTPRQQETPEAARGRVLVVEDEFLIASAVESDLNDGGFEVVAVANTANGAVALARETRPDLIIMDIRLVGGRDGVDAALEIFGETGIRCVFATAHADAQCKARAVAASPLGWLQKPYGREALLGAVEHAMETLRPA